MRNAAVILMLAGVLLSGQSKQLPKQPAKPGVQKFTGVITDSMCATGDHLRMKMGADDRECTIACVHAHGSDYVLFDDKNVYILGSEEKGEQFAGQKVTITGTLNRATPGRTVLEIQTIAAAR